MMYEQIDRKKCKWEAAELLREAQVSPKAMTALYMGLVLGLGLLSSVAGSGFLGIFISILASLLSTVLLAGFTLYCMAIRRGERAEYLTLFDGFSFVGKLILLELITAFFVVLWSMLFLIPGVIAAYRYSFAAYNLYENPGIGVMEALDMSKPELLRLDAPGRASLRLPGPADHTGPDRRDPLRHPRPGYILRSAHPGPGPHSEPLAAGGLPVLLPQHRVRPAGLFRNRQADLRRGPGGRVAVLLGRVERPGRLELSL